ncbi:class I SAM-dependent methyltransferase [Rhodococcus triatomae]|uniref:Methyltransferase domain-containing protein n=1 Tax=Rhodococcus triatomae TaxID=300028 RepID=A0A1G8QWE6_9NOCA|nr:class I SAM-dependent methyltransferase [Rhodococcus triatomae]QNG20766.1 class I SAM-dependent methyltransferase [Rhodococcus triatomae]QNG23318.1 class I SAM-dependent methyltransferase [Rhodococcus triatomae]SDJ09069.1 Methyltransferase domain-containing protein [Rhodococcus triatomae]
MSTFDDGVRAAAAPYSEWFLKVYDLWVVHLSNSWAWRCHRRNFLDLYAAHLGARHLEVGPGSGWALAHSDLPAGTEVTLLDLNPNSLAHTRRRIDERAAVATIRHDVFAALPDGTGPFDSVAIHYVLHCLPGAWPTKSGALANLAAALDENGTLFGSTVLGVGPRRNPFAWALTEAYNRVGAFHNRTDDLPGLEAALSASFHSVQVWVVGNVALFVAREPRR